ncbi:MAG: hypothetical protein II839_03315 [Kiritimatiellae bacterium]|nr:hypothetical protein [Kiritimatiellia bacterium]
MATAIKAIPTLKGREARSFLRRADMVERTRQGASGNRNDHPFCRMARSILKRSGVGK